MNDINQRLEKLEKEILKVQARNKRVEADKAWETSIARMLLIAVLTYTTTTILLFAINDKNFFINGIIATIGFFISTITIPFIKKLWIAKVYKR